MQLPELLQHIPTPIMFGCGFVFSIFMIGVVSMLIAAWNARTQLGRLSALISSIVGTQRNSSRSGLDQNDLTNCEQPPIVQKGYVAPGGTAWMSTWRCI